jgi:uncharacterized protein
METFLDYVVKGLVDRPDAVTITPSERNGMTIYELRVHPTDMGKIIGRQGATINAIRALVLVGSAKRGLRCALEVVDEEDGDGGERRHHEHGGHGHSHSHSHGPGTRIRTGRIGVARAAEGRAGVEAGGNGAGRTAATEAWRFSTPHENRCADPFPGDVRWSFG